MAEPVYDFTANFDNRIAAILEARNPDDIPFLVAFIRHLQGELKEAYDDYWKMKDMYAQ